MTDLRPNSDLKQRPTQFREHLWEALDEAARRDEVSVTAFLAEMARRNSKVRAAANDLGLTLEPHPTSTGPRRTLDRDEIARQLKKNVSHAEIARQLGCSRSSVTRIAGELANG